MQFLKTPAAGDLIGPHFGADKMALEGEVVGLAVIPSLDPHGQFRGGSAVESSVNHRPLPLVNVGKGLGHHVRHTHAQGIQADLFQDRVTDAADQVANYGGGI